MNERREHLESQLSAYLDGELSEQERTAVEAFLAEDAVARRLLAELRVTSRALASLPRAKAPPDLMDSLRARLERKALLEDEAPQRSTSQTYVGRRWIAAAAVIALSVVTGYIMWSFRGGETGPGGAQYALRENQPAGSPTEAVRRGVFDTDKVNTRSLETRNDLTASVANTDGERESLETTDARDKLSESRKSNRSEPARRQSPANLADMPAKPLEPRYGGYTRTDISAPRRPAPLDLAAKSETSKSITDLESKKQPITAGNLVVNESEDQSPAVIGTSASDRSIVEMPAPQPGVDTSAVGSTLSLNLQPGVGDRMAADSIAAASPTANENERIALDPTDGETIQLDNPIADTHWDTHEEFPIEPKGLFSISTAGETITANTSVTLGEEKLRLAQHGKASEAAGQASAQTTRSSAYRGSHGTAGSVMVGDIQSADPPPAPPPPAYPAASAAPLSPREPEQDGREIVGGTRKIQSPPEPQKPASAAEGYLWSNRPAAGFLSTTQPAQPETTSKTPPATQPVTSQPATSQPATTQPAVTQPAASQPANGKER